MRDDCAIEVSGLLAEASGRIVRIDTVDRLVQPVQARHVVQIACVNILTDVQDKLAGSFPGLFAASLRNIRRSWIA